MRSHILRSLALLAIAVLFAACGGSGNKSKASDGSDSSERSSRTEVSEFSEETDRSQSSDSSDNGNTESSGAAGVTDEKTFCSGAEGVADLNAKSKDLFQQPGETEVLDAVNSLLSDQDDAFNDMLDGSEGSLHDDIQGVYQFNVDSFDYADSKGATTVQEFVDAVSEFFTDHQDDASRFSAASQRINNVTTDVCGVSFL